MSAVCSFCGDEREANAVMTGPGVVICADCTGLAVQTLGEKVRSRSRYDDGDDVPALSHRLR